MPEFTWLRLVALVAFVGTYLGLALGHLPNVPAVLLLKTIVPGFGEPTRAWLLLAMASTLAGNLTIAGSVVNLIVVEAGRDGRIPIGFWEYARVGVPITLVTLAFGWAILVLLPA